MVLYVPLWVWECMCLCMRACENKERTSMRMIYFVLTTRWHKISKICSSKPVCNCDKPTGYFVHPTIRPSIKLTRGHVNKLVTMGNGLNLIHFSSEVILCGIMYLPIDKVKGIGKTLKTYITTFNKTEPIPAEVKIVNSNLMTWRDDLNTEISRNRTCVCVCVCARVSVRVCVCMCVCDFMKWNFKTIRDGRSK